MEPSTPFERAAYAINFELGERQAIRESIVTALKVRFGSVETTLESEINEIVSLRRLYAILGRVITVSSLEELRNQRFLAADASSTQNSP